MKRLIFIFLICVIWCNSGYNQNCNSRYYWTDCRKSVVRNCSKYMPPKTVMTGIYDTLRYNVVFYGDNDYIIAFCADRVYYPLNIRLVRPETGEIFYNNESDKYNRTIYVGFKKTQNCLIEVVLLAEHVKKEKLRQKENICVGMLLQIRNPLPAGDDLYLPK